MRDAPLTDREIQHNQLSGEAIPRQPLQRCLAPVQCPAAHHLPTWVEQQARFETKLRVVSREVIPDDERHPHFPWQAQAAQRKKRHLRAKICQATRTYNAEAGDAAQGAHDLETDACVAARDDCEAW